MNVLTSIHDKNKLGMLPATEKYILNISQKTGQPTFFRVTNLNGANSLLLKPSFAKTDQSYSVNEVRLKYARAYESWTEAEENQLISEYKGRTPILEIARIHQRKRNAIGSRLKKLIERGTIQP